MGSGRAEERLLLDPLLCPVGRLRRKKAIDWVRPMAAPERCATEAESLTRHVPRFRRIPQPRARAAVEVPVGLGPHLAVIRASPVPCATPSTAPILLWRGPRDLRVAVASEVAVEHGPKAGPHIGLDGELEQRLAEAGPRFARGSPQRSERGHPRVGASWAGV